MFNCFALLVRNVHFFCFIMIVPVSVTHSQMSATLSYPLKLSADGSYLVDQENQPFFMNGDTAWSLIVQLSQANVDTYLSDRAQKGFNLVLVNLIDRAFATNAPANLTGQAPFTTSGNFNTPISQMILGKFL